ncbi:hypothetical protein ABJI51_26705 [Amycolatopsis sp. NEAU-NG30]|uniref:Flagellar basal body-associated protein FliL n=1 Tax=Amycolatopsis melonis TaxID=3156488 RepID=A0ABV0LMV6_9PSEU
MSWQEDLRRLDADLAAGRIEPAAHRKQRDELLAAASGSTVPSPVPSPLRRPDNRSWQSTNPAHDRPAEPVPAPAVPPQPVAKAPTPQERPWMRGPHVPRTSSIPELPDHMTTAPSPADIVPTRYLRVEGTNLQHTTPSRFPPVGGGPGTAEAPPFGEPEGSGRHRWQTSPPAGDGSRRGLPAWLVVTLGVVLVAGLVAGGILWFGGKDDDQSGVAVPPPSPSVPSATNGVADPSLTLEQRLPTLPGKANPANATMTVEKALEAKVITEADAQQIRASNAKEVIFRASSDPGKASDGNLLMVIPTLSVFDAKHLVTGLRQNLSGAQLAATRLGPTDDDLMYTQRGSDSWVGILWYSSGAVAVGIGVSQAGTADSGALRSRLEAIRASVTAVLPPG